MTFGILQAHCLGDKLLYEQKLTRNGHYRLKGSFYEHRWNTTGFVFEQQQLEDFVQQYQRDPVTVEGSGLRNLADWFAEFLPEGKLFVFRNGLFSPHPLIQRHYTHYEVWERKVEGRS